MDGIRNSVYLEREISGFRNSYKWVWSYRKLGTESWCLLAKRCKGKVPTERKKTSGK